MEIAVPPEYPRAEQVILDRTTSTRVGKGWVTLLPITGWIWHHSQRKFGGVTENHEPDLPHVLANREFILLASPAPSISI